MNEITFFAFAHDLARVAQELMMRVGSSPLHMPMTLSFSRYLEDYADRVKQRGAQCDTYREARIDTALREGLVWRMYVLPQTPGNPADEDFVACLRAIALDLSFLAQRGYKVDREAIRNYALLAKDIALRVANTAALTAELRGIH